MESHLELVALVVFPRVADFADSHARLMSAGVEFVRPPRDEPYGRVAVFLDCEGNRWDLPGTPQS